LQGNELDDSPEYGAADDQHRMDKRFAKWRVHDFFIQSGLPVWKGNVGSVALWYEEIVSVM
jgi:hypothetical protein